MVIETFKQGAITKVYERFETEGRMLPRGLVYIDSWLSYDRSRCFQLMETEDVRLFDVWTRNWNDLVDFEIIQIQDSPTKRARRVTERESPRAAS
jgi:hypothetical protein